MNLMDIFSGKKPERVPTLAAATERLARARQAHSQHSDDLTRVQASLGLALLNEAGDSELDRIRKSLATIEGKVSESGMTLAAAESVHRTATEAADALARAGRDAAIVAKQDERHASAARIDAIIDTLAAEVQHNYDVHADLDALNPPLKVVRPRGLTPEGLMRIVEFRLRYREGGSYSPFRTLAEARVAFHLPGAPRDTEQAAKPGTDDSGPNKE